MSLAIQTLFVDLAAESDVAEVADFYDLQEPALGAEVETFLIECLRRLEALAYILKTKVFTGR